MRYARVLSATPICFDLVRVATVCICFSTMNAMNIRI